MTATAAQVSAVLAWAARLSAAGPRAGTAETAAYLTAKAALLERIAAGREHSPGWAPADAAAARDAAIGARKAADDAALAAAIGIATLEDR